MHLTLPWYIPFNLFAAWVGCRTALKMWKEKSNRGDVLYMLAVTLLPLAIWIFIQFFPQE